jgi:hypothetical protein
LLKKVKKQEKYGPPKLRGLKFGKINPKLQGYCV